MRTAAHVVDHTDRKPLAYGVLEQVIGPLVWQTEDRAEGRFGGSPIWVERVFTRGRHEHMFKLLVPTGRPVELSVHPREGYSGARSRLVTGDPHFDGKYVVHGSPPEVVQRALEPEVRAWMLSMRDSGSPLIATGPDSSVEWLRGMPTSQDVALGRRPITPTEIATNARGLQLLASRLIQEFDEACAAIARAEGPAAASAWAASTANQLAEARRVEAERSKRVALRFWGCVTAVLFTVVMGILALVVFALR